MPRSPWRTLSYVAAIPTLLPDALLAHLTTGARILELGCGHGPVCRLLARHGMVVTGVDINEVAIGAAREGAANVQPPITFIAADLLPEPAVVNERSFDAVLLIRFLTCFPDEGERRRLVNRAKAAVKIGGILYVRDFLLSAGYRKRYDEAARDGMSFGNFTVLTEDGSVRFVAYHHTEHEAMAMLSGCELISFRTEESLSMNGNPCTMFELMARRTGT